MWTWFGRRLLKHTHVHLNHSNHESNRVAYLSFWELWLTTVALTWHNTAGVTHSLFIEFYIKTSTLYCWITLLTGVLVAKTQLSFTKLYFDTCMAFSEPVEHHSITDVHQEWWLLSTLKVENRLFGEGILTDLASFIRAYPPMGNRL